MSQRVRSHVALGAVLLLTGLAAGGCREDDAPTGLGDVTASVVNSIHYDTQILGVLHEANVGEIITGQVAEQRATNGDVKAFATSMFADHTTLDTDAAILAAQLGLAPELPTPALPDQQSAEASQLSGLSGTAFDRAYVTEQVMAHERTLAIIDASIARAKRPQLRAMLETDIRPHIVEHLTTVQQLRAKLGAP